MRRLDKYERRQKSSRYTSKDRCVNIERQARLPGTGTDGDGAMTLLEYLAASCLVVLIVWAIAAATAT